MGNYASALRGDGGNDAENGIEVAESGLVEPAQAYRYPPMEGSYFGSHFIMGGTRFPSFDPEAYLFGPLSDLNFLNCGKLPALANPPTSHLNVTTSIRSLLNLRKDTMRVRCSSTLLFPVTML
eukprot:Opistho-2@88330